MIPMGMPGGLVHGQVGLGCGQVGLIEYFFNGLYMHLLITLLFPFP